MKTFFMSISTVAAMTVSGCAMQLAPSEDSQSISNVVVKQPPRLAYQNLVRQARARCFPMTIDAQFYQDTNEADVSMLTTFNVSNQVVWAVFALRPNGQDTAVTIRSPGRIKEFFAPATKWMNGEEAPCPVDLR